MYAPEEVRSPRISLRAMGDPELCVEPQRSKTSLKFFKTFVKRGKACSRNAPYVALPFDPGRLRPELVGFLLHPISRSETWRRLLNSKVSAQKLLARS